MKLREGYLGRKNALHVGRQNKLREEEDQRLMREQECEALVAMGDLRILVSCV